ncbi:tail assembly protein [Gilliamella sp. W8126]|uniref:tail assembly protein n=1 Tax=Gilliamella sp. W8126 TaxID=2750946 RepID=UPI0018DBFCEC|nr:tail assembly protein [Gilliamella sp. W8126]MBI0005161.1 tail assembly protein [Gilliamella sp. W8126]
MAKIRLYGDLKQYGYKFDMNIETAAEGLNGLYCQIDGLRQKIMDGWFRVRINGVDMTDDNLQFGLHSRLPENAVIHIVPKVAGAKGGMFSFIAGAALAVAGVIVGVTTGIGFALVAAGAGMMLGGVAGLLTKTPKTEIKSGESNRNTYFSNLDNTIAQGAPVPMIYGRIKIGSKVLSQGLEVLEETTSAT